MAGLEGAKHASVVGVFAGVHDAPAPGAIDRDAHGLALEELRRLAEVADEDEGARALEELLRGVGELEQEARGGPDGVADVAENDQLGAVATPTRSHDVVRDTPGAHGAAKRAMRVDSAVARSTGPNARGAAQSLGEAADGAADLVDLGVRESGKRHRLEPTFAALQLELGDASVVRLLHEGSDIVLGAFELRREGIRQRGARGRRARPRVQRAGAQASGGRVRRPSHLLARCVR